MGRWALWVGVLLLLARVGPAQGAAPHIDLIEPLGQDLVLIHFYTEPNRQYVVQYSTNAHPIRVTNITATATNVITTNRWFNFYTVPCQPFADHHIAATGRTNTQRFYRLRVTNCN